MPCVSTAAAQKDAFNTGDGGDNILETQKGAFNKRAEGRDIGGGLRYDGQKDAFDRKGRRAVG